uniref:Fatty acyl-CoA reductase n=1 Tax=Timema monikensis TaxID=170555 RepID=A0A7R9E5N9_9NEOP|nr:unnamed protein product [Timema monikensis]
MVDISEGSKIAEFYKGQTLFITGASGFMGKVLLEKILYACPGIVKIYILVRPKRGKSPQTRLEEMSKLPLFHRVRKERPHAFEKVVLVNGDVTMENLGLSSKDRTLLENEVTVVFHSAATLRLEAILKDAVEMNLNGTWRMLQLCKKMSRLKVLVHLSTAFCHCDYEELEERMYPCSVDPHDVMRCCQWMDPALLESITPSLISPHPNTYTFSKRLAEILVANEHPNLPVCGMCSDSTNVSAVCAVTPAWREPLPGWVDNLNGPIGLMVAAGKGVVRSVHLKGEYHSEVIPVDFAINGLLMLAAKVGSSSDREVEERVDGDRTSKEGEFAEKAEVKDVLKDGGEVEKSQERGCHWEDALRLSRLEEASTFQMALRQVTRSGHEEGQKVAFPVPELVDRIQLRAVNPPTATEDLKRLVEKVVSRRGEKVDWETIYRHFVKAHGRVSFNAKEAWPSCYVYTHHP